MLERNGLKVPKYVRQAKNLSRFAVVTRYPSEESVVTQREYRRAIRIATAVLRWAERLVDPGGKKPGGTK